MIVLLLILKTYNVINARSNMCKYASVSGLSESLGTGQSERVSSCDPNLKVCWVLSSFVVMVDVSLTLAWLCAGLFS